MASMNSDIRLPSRSRTVVALLGLALVAFFVAFAVSFLPFVASAHDAEFTNNHGTVSAAPGATVHVNLSVNLDDGSSVAAVSYWFDSSAATCVALTGGTVTNSSGGHISGMSTGGFDVVAPSDSVNTTHDLFYKVSASAVCDPAVTGSTQPDSNSSHQHLRVKVVVPTVTNTAPVAVAQNLTTDMNVPLAIILSGTDADAGTVLVIATSTNTAHGTLTGTAPSLTYTPAVGYTGADSFDFTVGDGLATTTGTVSITVNTVSAPACNNSTTFDAFNLGTVNSQGGWNSTGPYDQAVVSNTYGFTTFGCQTLRISNAVTSGNFGDQTFSPSITNEAGETTATSSSMSGGTRQNHFEAQFDLASAVPGAVQTGMVLSVSPDRGDGARMSYLRFEDHSSSETYTVDTADATHLVGANYTDGIHVYFDDVQGENAGFQAADFEEVDIATLDRTAPHTIKFSMDFVDGASNDIVKIYIDGNLVHTGTSWENYYRFDTESQGTPHDVTLENVSRTVDSLIFRAGGTAVSANSGKGFLIDNMAVTSGSTSGSGSSSGGGNGGGGNPAPATTNNGGGTVVGLIGTVNTNPTGTGQVLGASTDLPAGCSLYLGGYFKKGSNDTAGVKKLQSFLNQNLGLSIPVTGVFGPVTLDAVEKFQTKYADDILKPWFEKGLSKDMQPSGYVYKTTLRMINLLSCSTLEIPVPQLP